MTVHELFPYLCVHNASEAITYYQRAFGGVEQYRLTEPSGRIGHAEVKIGDFVVMLCEEFPELGIRAPTPGERVPVVLHLHVDNADEMIERAVSAGGSVVRPVQDQFFGERMGRVRDPFGHEWLIGHAIEKVSTAEMQRRYTALFQ